MKKSPLFWIIIAAAVVGVILVIRAVAGAYALMNSALNAVIAVAVILGVVVIVIWMFWYARKNQ
jgi:arginine exporter protein ArgO